MMEPLSLPNSADAAKRRPLLLDGAMGTMLQAGHSVREVHRAYLEAGADLITTNTFEAGLTDEALREAVRIAREEAVRMTRLTPQQPRYVVGDVGPTGRMLSMSEDVSDPAARSIDFATMAADYQRWMQVLADEGVDVLLVETSFDTLNVKAAIWAYEEVSERIGKRLPLMLSMTISDASGRMLSGQTIEAFAASVMHARPYSIGMNCGLGAEAMIPYLHRLRECVGSVRISCHPNAGLPNAFGAYDQQPEQMAAEIRLMLAAGLVDIVGGCCGTTPEHIRALRQVLDEQPWLREVKPLPEGLRLSGLEAFTYAPTDWITVGEQCNVAGSRKFLRLINEKQYDEALAIARRQVERGAHVIDINFDDGLLDAAAEMTHFLRLLASDPDVARIPLMIDSSDFRVVEAGLQNCQGKCIVNSLSLKQGEEEFLRQARIVRKMGAAVVVMCFDEEGQANDFARRIQIAERAYRLLTEQAGFVPTDIIFDPNVLTIATGMDEHRDYAASLIRATEWITTHLPGARVSGGISNLSFAFRGNNVVRRAMHAVFLHLAEPAGMHMAIMNAATAVRYDDVEPTLRQALTDVILNTSPDATEHLSAIAAQIAERAQQAAGSAVGSGSQQTTTAVSAAEGALSPIDSLVAALVKGDGTSLSADLDALLAQGQRSIDIISGPLMAGMNEVGRLFGEGRMFLPQVVKTARTMKQAVDYLTEHGGLGADSAAGSAALSTASRGKVLLATVKGDVHDIGKNIVGVVLGCNGFTVIDLGVMVSRERIVEAAVAEKVDVVCLSGLITPSLAEMAAVADAMQEAGLSIPLLVGGATTSALHTAVQLAPRYSGGVFHMTDASRNPIVISQLLDPARREATLEANRQQQRRLRLAQQQRASRLKVQMMVEKSASASAPACAETNNAPQARPAPVHPPFMGQRVLEPIRVAELIGLIDWRYFFHAWRVAPDCDEAALLKADAEALLQQYATDESYALRAIAAFYPARALTDSIRIGTEVLATPRQSAYLPSGQKRRECLALSDFVSASGDDYAGVFAVTMSEQFQHRLEALHKQGTDIYAELLQQTLGDRLAEAAAEYLSRRWAEVGWGGIRPAIGYPCLPEQQGIFTLARLIDYSAIGISLTENGAMYPQSSVSGVYLSNPAARYFTV